MLCKSDKYDILCLYVFMVTEIWPLTADRSLRGYSGLEKEARRTGGEEAKAGSRREAEHPQQMLQLPVLERAGFAKTASPQTGDFLLHSHASQR
jgi:hypothetical protein